MGDDLFQGFSKMRKGCWTSSIPSPCLNTCVSPWRILLLLQRYRTARAYTDTGFTSLAKICLIGIGLAILHLKHANRTIIHALFAAFAFVSVDRNQVRTHSFTSFYGLPRTALSYACTPLFHPCRLWTSLTVLPSFQPVFREFSCAEHSNLLSAPATYEGSSSQWSLSIQTVVTTDTVDILSSLRSAPNLLFTVLVEYNLFFNRYRNFVQYGQYQKPNSPDANGN